MGFKDAYKEFYKTMNPRSAAQMEHTEAATKNTELQNRITQMKLDHSEAVKSLGAAESAFKTGDLKGMVQYLGKVYDKFPDGGKIGKVHYRHDGMVVDIHNRDGTMRQELVTHQNAQNYLEKGRAILDPQAYISARMNLDAERDGFNKVQKQKPQETVDGTYAYQQMDNNGNFTWVEVDKNGKERELKTKPKLLSEQIERLRAEQEYRKGEADIDATKASAEKDRADAEYARGGKGQSKEPTESYPGEHSDKINKGLRDIYGVMAGPDEDGNISSYNLDTKNAVDKDLARRGRIGLWKPRKKGWGGGIEYEFMGHTEGPKEGDVGIFGDAEGNIHEAVYKDGNWVKKEDGSEEKPEDIQEEVIERVEAADEPAEPEEPPKQPEKAPVEEYQKEINQVARWLRESPAKEKGQMERLTRAYGERTARQIIDSAKEINKSLKDTPHPWPAAAKEAGKDLLSMAQALSDRATPSFDPALGGARITRSGTKKDWNMPAQK